MTRDIRDRVADGLLAMLPLYHRHILRTRAGSSGFGIAQYRALGMLVKSGPLSMTELCRLLFVSKPSMTVLADSLVENGWAERETCSQDRRIVRLAILPAGKKHLQQAFEVYRADARALLEGLGTDDLERMSAALDELERVFAKLEERG
jgi:DNA-binding MarR family transcriptional regulator